MTQDNPTPPLEEAPDTDAINAALEVLREALAQERESNSSELSAATAAFDSLKALYDDQTRKYKWAEDQRQEFWRLYNFVLKLLGVPKQPFSRPYTLEEFQAELAKLPAKPDVAALQRELNDERAKLAAANTLNEALATRVIATEQERDRLGAENASLKQQQADFVLGKAEVTRAIADVKTTLDKVERALK